MDVTAAYRRAREDGYTLLASQLANLGFAAYDGYLGQTLQDPWYGALAAYYLVLAVARLWLVRVGPDASDEGARRAARRAGRALLGVGTTVGGITFLATWRDAHASYHALLIYGMAAFCFAHLGVAVAGAVRARTHPSPCTRAARALSLASALVSLYQLQTALIATFSTGDFAHDNPFNLLLGATVFMVVIGMGLNLVARNRPAQRCEESRETSKP